MKIAASKSIYVALNDIKNNEGTIKAYAEGELRASIERALETPNLYDLEVPEPQITYKETKDEESGEVHVKVSAKVVVDGQVKNIRNRYTLKGDKLYFDKVVSPKQIAGLFDGDLRTYHNIESSTYIAAADEDDPFADMEFEDDTPSEESEDVEDTLNDLSDTLDDLSDSLDDFEEDSVDIEVDNNIDGHYIAECDSCHNVFITSVIDSGQEIEKISGICPVCDEESDQYIKWVIRDIKEEKKDGDTYRR